MTTHYNTRVKLHIESNNLRYKRTNLYVHFIHSNILYKSVNIWYPTMHFITLLLRICFLEWPEDDSVRVETLYI